MKVLIQRILGMGPPHLLYPGKTGTDISKKNVDINLTIGGVEG